MMSTNNTIAIVGGKGFVGSMLNRSFINQGNSTITITRENYNDYKNNEFKFVVNCAMPSGRFWAKNNPELDFIETVQKTFNIKHHFKNSKIIQISSISAKVQLDTIYGRHKLAAENLLDIDNDLIIRLGPLYSNSLKKGAIIDIINNQTVYVSGSSKYAFTPLEWVCDEIVNNKNLSGVHELGAKNYIELYDLAKKINSKSKFIGDVDDQVFSNAPDYCPDAKEVINFISNGNFNV